MKSILSKLVWFVATGLVVAVAISACGGSSGGGGGGLIFQGRLLAPTAGRTAQSVGVGVPGVTVNALGSSAVTDANGEFSLEGDVPSVGEVLFEFVSDLGTATTVVDGLPGVAATVTIDFTANVDGSIDSEITSIVESGSPSPEPTETASPEPTETASPEPTETASPEPTETASPEPTETASPEPTETASPEPTATETPDLPSCSECIALCVADPTSGGSATLCEQLCTTGFGDVIPPGLCP